MPRSVVTSGRFGEVSRRRGRHRAGLGDGRQDGRRRGGRGRGAVHRDAAHRRDRERGVPDGGGRRAGVAGADGRGAARGTDRLSRDEAASAHAVAGASVVADADPVGALRRVRPGVPVDTFARVSPGRGARRDVGGGGGGATRLDVRAAAVRGLREGVRAEGAAGSARVW